MTPLVPMLACSGPVAAGWAVHVAMLARRLRASRRDPVTGLATRAAWTRQASGIVRAEASTVILLDLDKFKEANDTYGHAAGDAVLTATAHRLCAWADRIGGGACGRLGGDEFAVVTRRHPCVTELWELLKQLSTPVTLPDGRAVAVSASIGVTPDPDAGQEHTDLCGALGAADAAMYRAKQAGGGWRYATAIPDHDPTPVKRTRHHGQDASDTADLNRL